MKFFTSVRITTIFINSILTLIRQSCCPDVNWSKFIKCIQIFCLRCLPSWIYFLSLLRNILSKNSALQRHRSSYFFNVWITAMHVNIDSVLRHTSPPPNTKRNFINPVVLQHVTSFLGKGKNRKLLHSIFSGIRRRNSLSYSLRFKFLQYFARIFLSRPHS